MAATASGRGYDVTLIDPMLAHLAQARARAAEVGHQFATRLGTAAELGEEDASADAVLLMGPLYHLIDPDDRLDALTEARRVLRPGGRLAILEITHPRGLLRPFFSLWFDRIVPLLGKLLPGGRAYTYLPASVRRFPGAEELAALLERHGFGHVRFRLMGGTIVALHTAVATVESGD